MLDLQQDYVFIYLFTLLLYVYNNERTCIIIMPRNRESNFTQCSEKARFKVTGIQATSA